MNTDPAIILDPGSGSIKFGVSYFDQSCEQKIYQNMSIPSIYGTSKYPSELFRKRPLNKGAYQRDYVIGTHALMLFDLLNVTFPVHRGIVTDWDIVMKILHNGLQTFQSTVEIPNSILVSEPWFQPRKKRENMVEIIFEKYSYENFFSVPQVVLTLFNYSQKSGYVVESGAEQTQFAAIFNGHKIQNRCFNFNKGGFDVSIQIPNEKNVDQAYFQNLNSIEKPMFGKVYLNPYQHLNDIERIKKNPPENFGSDVSQLYDQVFFPSLKDEPKENLAIKIHDYCQKDEVENPSFQMPKELYLGGGNFACEHFRNKIEDYTKEVNIRTHTLSDDEFEWSVWKGGNKFVNMSAMKDFWIPVTDYYESGPNVINFCCL